MSKIRKHFDAGLSLILSMLIIFIAVSYKVKMSNKKIAKFVFQGSFSLGIKWPEKQL